MTLRRTTSTTLALAAGVLTALVAVPAPAFAAPVATADRYAVYAGGTYTFDPLTNDDTTFLSTGELSLCGFAAVDTQRLYVEQSGDTLVVQVRDGIKGRTRFTYDACQGSQRDTAVIIVDVARLTDVSGVKKKNTRGKVLFTNPNDVPVRVSYGSATSGRPDATRAVPARGTITVGTTRRSLFWVALYSDDGVSIRVGDDTIGNLQTRSAKRSASRSATTSHARR